MRVKDCDESWALFRKLIHRCPMKTCRDLPTDNLQETHVKRDGKSPKARSRARDACDVHVCCCFTYTANNSVTNCSLGRIRDISSCENCREFLLD